MADLAEHVLLLSGPPGSGKTTAAGALARRPGRPAVHIPADDFWAFVGTGRRLPVDPGAEPLNETVRAAVAGAAGGFAAGGLFTVVDCVIEPRSLAPFLALGRPLHLAILRVPPALAVARCAARRGDALRDAAIIRALHARFADLGDLAGHAIDVGDSGPEAALDRIEEALASGCLRLRGPDEAGPAGQPGVASEPACGVRVPQPVATALAEEGPDP